MNNEHTRASSRDMPRVDPLDGLPLLHATAPEWADVALGDLVATLIDHAHCEHKAASSALAMLGRFAERKEMLRPLIALAQEEIHHFRQVLDLVEARGQALTRPRPDRYVKQLRDRGFRLERGLGALGDLLLVSAFVEARSCERFRLLATALLDPAREASDDERALGDWYRRLAAAEGRHWELFRDLTIDACGEKATMRRLDQFAELEADIVRALPLEARMH